MLHGYNKLMYTGSLQKIVVKISGGLRKIETQFLIRVYDNKSYFILRLVLLRCRILNLSTLDLEAQKRSMGAFYGQFVVSFSQNSN